MATEVIVTQADIDDLAKKLDEFGAVLNDREKAVLLGVLGLAGQGIDKAAAAAAPAAPAAGAAAPALPSLSAGFRNAFQKGVGTRFKFDQSQTENTTVKGTVSIDSTRPN